MEAGALLTPYMGIMSGGAHSGFVLDEKNTKISFAGVHMSALPAYKNYMFKMFRFYESICNKQDMF